MPEEIVNVYVPAHRPVNMGELCQFPPPLRLYRYPGFDGVAVTVKDPLHPPKQVGGVAAMDAVTELPDAPTTTEVIAVQFCISRAVSP